MRADSISCDGEGCRQFLRLSPPLDGRVVGGLRLISAADLFLGAEHTLEEINQKLRDAGWVERSGHHFCPAHQEGGP